MYRVVIAEDEMLVRNGIKNSINWSKFDMEVVSDVPNGKLALAVCQEQSPEVLITDIKMPIMDGIELIKRLRESNKSIKIIILSCLEDFDIARKAMNLGVTDYILKLTMTFEEMEAVLEKVYNELKSENAYRESPQTSTEDKELIKENLFKNFIFYSLYSNSEFDSKIKELGCRLTSSKHVISIMLIEDYKNLVETFDDEKGWLIRFSLLNVINEILESYHCGEVFQDDDNRFVLIFSFEEIMSELKIREQLHIILEHLKRVFKSFFNVEAAFGVSGIKSGYGRLKENYEEGRRATILNFYSGNNLINYYDADRFKNLAGLLSEKLNSFYNRIRDGKLMTPEQIKKVELVVHDKINDAAYEKSKVLNCFISLTHFLPTLLSINEEVASSIIISFSSKISESITIDQVLDMFLECIVQLNEKEQKGRKLSREIAEAIKYIKQNYNQELSLQQIAKVVSISPNYLSSLFKKELDLNFIDYLNLVRVENAKVLLRSSNLKSYEISEKVGFSHDSYFNRIFKKITGVTPSEYKKQWTLMEVGVDNEK